MGYVDGIAFVPSAGRYIQLPGVPGVWMRTMTAILPIAKAMSASSSGRDRDRAYQPQEAPELCREPISS